MSNNYQWAANQAKLATAIQHVTERSKVDPSVKVDDETVKAEYVRLLGLVREADASDDNEDAEEAAPKAKRKTRSR